MKLFFSLVFAIGLLVGAWSSFANHIPMPNLPIGKTAFNVAYWDTPCGELTAYLIGDWQILTIDKSWVRISNYTEGKIWLIRNLDGHIDEYYSEFDFYRAKYPSICDAIKK